MECGFYHPTIGYWQTLTQPDEETIASYPVGTAQVPLQPSPIHTWNGSAWQEPTQEAKDAYAADEVRNLRNFLLITQVDPIATNALRWAAMSDAERQAWSDYRQALLDITDQSGFPHNVTWPTKPE